MGGGWPADPGADGCAMSLDVPLATPREADDRPEIYPSTRRFGVGGSSRPGRVPTTRYLEPSGQLATSATVAGWARQQETEDDR